jgi:hypothetical protein
LHESSEVDLADCGKILNTTDSRGSQLQKPAALRIDHYDRLVDVQDQDAAGHRIDHLLQGGAHPIVFSKAAAQSDIALCKF